MQSATLQPSPPLPASNAAHAFGAAFFEELARAGLRHVCVCPGSRSTPLTAAAVRRPELRAWSHVDERAAAFFALGLARAAREPVALVCTSGTAAANFHPAVIEAHHAGVPLLVLTADRPPELRGWGAPQTIDQLRLYGPCVRWFAEVALPEPSGAHLRYARALACRALAEAAGPPPGPVHLNLPFREPLEPSPSGGDAPEAVAGSDALGARGRDPAPFARVERAPQSPPPETVRGLCERARRSERGVVVCGPLDAEPALAAAVARFAGAAGWPVLADASSPLRRGPHAARAPILAGADLFLRDAAASTRFAPECVLQLGGTPTSKALARWLEASTPAHLLRVDPAGAWSDPGHLASQWLRVDPAALCEAAAAQLEASPPRRTGGWLAALLEAERRTAEAVERELAASGELLEPAVAREVAEAVPEGGLLYVSNSMPVRDLDAFLPRSPRALRVLCNRGASGIDGMLSSALGAAAAGRGPVALLTGDLAFLHDVGGLLAARRHGLAAAIVVVHNDGGGIFSFLPVAAHGESLAFEEFFRTPHGLDLEPLARGFGAAFERARSAEHLRAALKEAFAAARTTVIEVPVDRDRNVAHHRAIERAVSRALAAETGP